MLSNQTRKLHAMTAIKALHMRNPADFAGYVAMEFGCYSSLFLDIVDDPRWAHVTILQDFKSRWHEMKRAWVEDRWQGFLLGWAKTVYGIYDLSPLDPNF